MQKCILVICKMGLEHNQTHAINTKVKIVYALGY